MKYKLAKPLSIHELGQRKNQEDSIFPKLGAATENDRLFILCDGMGGHEAGEVASQAVCQTMSDHILSQADAEGVFTESMFNDALQAAYDSLDEKDNAEDAKKMGTTMTFVKFHAGGCMVAHIGDSRIYHIRPSEKEILYVSRDHSLVRDLYELGEITWEEMKTSKQKNIITRAMQPHQPKRAKADVRNITDIRPGDYFFMCSDGMLEEMEDNNLLNILSDDKTSDEEKVYILTEVSKDSRDNHSAHLIHVLEVEDDEQERVSDVASEPVAETPAEDAVTPAPKSVSQTISRAAVPEDGPVSKKGSTFSKILKVAVFLVLLFALIYFVVFYFLNGGEAA